jgi:CubicO group peptidase (beta-lactamase class C family)
VGSFWNERYLANHARVRSVADYLALFEHDSLLFTPGTGEAYSNGGYVLLGAIIERVSGQSYHEYVRDHIFRPAGMTETVPYDRLAHISNAAVGYTAQPLMDPPQGDRRLAGTGARPGYPPSAAVSSLTPQGRVDSTVGSHPQPPDSGHAEHRLKLIGPDGRELSPDEVRAAMAQHEASPRARQPNTPLEPGMSGPAGDDYSTARDLTKLADALLSRRLLDSARTAQVLGDRFAHGGEFRANGGGPGVNSELSIYPSGDILVVLSNYDPPAATAVAQFARSLLAIHRP